MGKKLTEDELAKTMEFCQRKSPSSHHRSIADVVRAADVFAPADNDITAEVASRFDPQLLSIAAPVFSPEELNKVIDPEDTDAVAVINRINSAKVLGAMWVKGPSIMENEPVNGMVARLERGKLGLAVLEQASA